MKISMLSPCCWTPNPFWDALETISDHLMQSSKSPTPKYQQEKRKDKQKSNKMIEFFRNGVFGVYQEGV
jgi:hypothetical protein